LPSGHTFVPGTLILQENVGGNVTVYGTFTPPAAGKLGVHGQFVNNGTFGPTSGIATVSGSGSFTNNGSFQAGNVSLLLKGTGSTTIKSGSRITALTINAVGGTVTLQGDLTVNGGLTLTAGTLDASSSNYSLKLNSSLLASHGRFNGR